MRKPVRLDRGPRAQQGAGTRAAPPAGPAAPRQQGSALGQGCGVVLAILLGLFLLGKCSSDAPDVAGNATQVALSEPAYVAARSLNCRREPEASAAIAEGLSRDDQVVVAERRGDWARLTRVGGDCWVSGSFLASTPLGSAAVPSASPPSGAQGLMSSGTTSTVAAAGAGYVAGKSVGANRKYRGSKRRGASRSRRGSGGGYQGSGCPCSGSQVCIGPRGGRYCITSGGNKRYGV